MAGQPIQIVDDEDRVIGAGPIAEVRRQGQWHRIARVIVKDAAGHILLQKRAAHIKTYPGYWDTSAAGHVDEAEDYRTAAAREMREEIGWDATDLREVDYYKSENKYEGLNIRRFNKTFETTVSPDTEFELDPAEVSETRWFSSGELKRMSRYESQKMTDGLQDYIRRKL